MNSPTPQPSVESSIDSPKPRSFNTLRVAILAMVFAAPIYAQASEPLNPEKSPSPTLVYRKKTPDMVFKEGLGWIGAAKSEEMKKKNWLRLAGMVPALTLKNSEMIPFQYSMEVIRVAAENAVARDPFGFLENAFFCTDLPDYQKMILRAADRAADLDPKSTLEFEGVFSGFPGGEKIVEKAKKNLQAKESRDKLVKK